MKIQDVRVNEEELSMLCNTIRMSVKEREYQKYEPLIYDTMKKYPHAPEPHNLIGVLLELQGDHMSAMKHFRAAWALDPTYLPARHNLSYFGTFFSKGTWALEELDCATETEKNNCKLVYDKNGIGHVVRREQK